MITVLFVRHADVDVPPPIGNPDYSLNVKGVLRANELAHVAEKAGVTAIFTSDLKRTKETAAPLAMRLGLAQPLPVVSDSDVEQFAADVRAGKSGPVVLVVGHTNTIPRMIDALAGSPQSVAVQGFDNLYLVPVAIGASQMIRLRYGSPSD
jgi:broad specificity phosphatase PhoE